MTNFDRDAIHAGNRAYRQFRDEHGNAELVRHWSHIEDCERLDRARNRYAASLATIVVDRDGNIVDDELGIAREEYARAAARLAR